MTQNNGSTWYLKGSIVGACNCDWGCPCNFDAPPTYGYCNGAYVWRIQEGRFGEVALDGLSMGWVGESPGAMHLGHGTTQLIIDERADEDQRAALLILARGKSGGPFEILASVTETWLDPIFAPFEIVIDGLNSRATVPGVLELGLTSIKNPVTGEDNEVRIVFPTGGLIWDEGHTATTNEMRVDYGEIKFEYPGQSAFFSPIVWTNQT